MSHCLSPIDIFFHHTVLKDPNGRKKIKCLFVAWLDSIEYETDNNLLPCQASFVPELSLLQVDDIPNILHNAVQGSGGEYLILIVVGDRDHHLGVSVVH